MATIDEILDAMPEEDATTGRDYLVIDPATRTITVPDSEKVFGVEGDEDAARKYFICPRYVGDNLDLASMFLTVYYRNANGDADGYLVNDVAVNGDYVTFSWLLSPKAVAYQGALQFSVCADLPNTPNKRRPDWNTTTATGDVLEGQHPDVGDVEAETSDVVTQLRAEIAASTAAVEAAGAAQVDVVKVQGTNTTQEAVAAIQAQGAATKASIPADYTALAAQVDNLTRGRAAAIVCEAAGAAIQVQDASDDPLQGLRIFGKSTQADTPTPDAPVEIVSTPAPAVTVCGRNLLQNTAETRTHLGVDIAVNMDGSVVLNGTATSEGTLVFNNRVTLPPGDYVLAGGKMVAFLRASDNTHKNTYFTGTTITIEEPTDYLLIGVYANKGQVFDNVKVYPMLRLATDSDDTYEQYTGQALPITTPGSLPGIPVASGGNYTDENGQQWICDEVDLARGVHVQRVTAKKLTGAESFEDYIADNGAVTLYLSHKDGSNFICTHAVYGKGVYWANTSRVAFRVAHWGVSTMLDFKELVAECHNAGFPVTLCYILAKPVETALTDVELQAYLALHSNKPTTTVLNDAGAHMVLEYAADPKTYIDNKLAALAAANN